jgi:hypothetical protein
VVTHHGLDLLDGCAITSPGGRRCIIFELEGGRAGLADIRAAEVAAIAQLKASYSHADCPQGVK